MNLLKSLFANAGLPTDGGLFAPKAQHAPVEEPVGGEVVEIKAGAGAPAFEDVEVPASTPVSEDEEKYTKAKLENDTLTWEVEYTDTFGGEANYSWVKRERITLPMDATDRSIVIAAKKAVGLTGVKCDTERFNGEMIALRPRGMCTIVFITPVTD